MHNLIRKVEAAKGIFVNGYYPSEKKAFENARKSIVSSKFIKKGTKITSDMLTAKRPGIGINPEHMNFLIGLETKIDIDNDVVITKEMF